MDGINFTTARVHLTPNPDAPIRAIAQTGGSFTTCDALHVSYDGQEFFTVLYDMSLRGGGVEKGVVTQPALDIDHVEVTLDDNHITYGGVDYHFDPDATISSIVTKPVMWTMRLVDTADGTYYVEGYNQLTGSTQAFWNGEALITGDGSIYTRADADGVVERSVYVGHVYVVTGDHLDQRGQTATFDGRPAKPLDAEKYTIVYADDLSTVTVTPKQ